MSKLADILKKRIQQIKNTSLKTLLLSHLNPKADKNYHFFTKIHPNTRSITISGRASRGPSNAPPYELVLNMIFAFAPANVCDEVAEALINLPKNEFIEHLSLKKISSEARLNERVMPTLMQYAPASTKEKLLARIKELPELDKVELLFGKPKSFANFLELFNQEDPISSKPLVELLASINKKTRFKLFQTATLPVSYEAFIGFFKQNKDENLSLSMLEILKEHNGEELKKLAAGSNANLNLLHVIFENQSPLIVEALLEIILTMDDAHLEKLFTKRAPDEPNETPLEIAFKRKNAPNVASAIVRKLMTNPKLKSLLTTVSNTQHHSPIHLAAATNNTQAIKHFIEHPKADAYHRTYSTQQTLQEIAKEKNYHEIVTLIDALPLYRLIKHSKNEEISAEEIVRISEQIDENPGILICRDSSGKRLLHQAAIKGNVSVTKVLLEKGARLEHTDDNNLTAIDAAVQNNHVKIIECFITQVATNPDVSLPTFAGTLTRLPASANKMQLEKVLQTPTNNPLDDTLRTYSQQSSDAHIFFLLEAAKFLNETSHPELLNACTLFLQTNLEQFAKVPKNNSIELQLICFLFSINLEKLEWVVSSQSLSHQFGLLLLHGLVKPAIFSSLTLAAHKHYLKVLHQLSHKHHDLPQSLANFHFQHSDLMALPPEILQELGNLSEKDSLPLHVEQRRSATLIVLALQKLLNEESLNQDVIKGLLSELTYEVSLFNKDENRLDDREILLFLNLSEHKTLKEFFQNELNKLGENSPLQRRLNRLFSSFKRTDALLPNGFLRTLFINFALDKTNAIHEENHPAIRELLAVSTKEETAKITEAMLPIVEPPLVLSSRLSPISSSVEIQGDALSLSQWIYSLNDKINRFELVPLVTKLDGYCIWLNALIAKLPPNNYQDLQHSLTVAVAELDFLANYIFNAHVETDAIDQDLLNNKFTSLRNTFNEVNSKLLGLDKSHEFFIKHKKAIENFATLSSIENINAVVFEIRTVCNRLADEDLSHIHALISTLPDTSALQPLSTIFTGQVEQEQSRSIIRAAKALDCQTKQLVVPLIHHVVEGLLSNSECSDPSNILRWVYLSVSPGDTEKIFNQLTSLIKSSNPLARATINALLNQDLSLIRNCMTIVMDLKILMVTDVTLPQLLKILYDTDTQLLLEFRKICRQANCYDLLYLIDYVRAAKKDKMPLELLISSCPHQSVPNIANWVELFNDKLENYSSRVMSLKMMVDGLFLDNSVLSNRLEALSNALHEQAISPESTAIVELMHSYHEIFETNKDSQRDIIIVFSELLRSTKLSDAYDVISKLPIELLNLILHHCLSGGNYDDSLHRAACKNLLSLICQSNNQLNVKSFELIKSELGRQDFEVLGTSELSHIATQVLNEADKDLNDCTLSGVWIQRLLTSPLFVAASNPEALQALIERYRLISLTLKQAEFEALNARLKSKINLNPNYRKTINRIEIELTSPRAKKAILLKQREELLNFRAEDSIRALLIELEENCMTAKPLEREMADKALEVLYTHYNTNLKSLRSDLLFQITDYLYSAAVRNKGDIAIAQNTLLGWLGNYLPHMNFEQKELSRKKNVVLCNEEGKEIGFVNESNHVMSLQNDEICPMTDVKGSYTGMQFYDENRRIIGSLSATGQFKRENLFQRHTSAQLVANVPTNDLAQSPAALKLLLEDVFTENSVDTLYNAADKSRHTWIEEQIQLQLPLLKKRVSFVNMEAMVKYQSPSSLLELLKSIEHPENAEQLFKAIIKDPNARKALFNNENPSYFFAFLTRHNPSQQFATFLSEHHDKSWFISGLRSFANYANVHNQPELLASALFILNQRCYEHKTLSENTYDAILHALLASEDSATIMWKSFLKADVVNEIQQVDVTLAKKLTQFFYKHHFTPVIETINEQKKWASSCQYRLLLLIFAQQRKQIFPQNELRYSEKLAWTPKELSQLCKFVKRHNNLKNSYDKDNQLGKKLLSELIFRCANFGNTDLFYQSDKTFDEKMATHTLHRTYLNATAARNYIKKAVNGLVTTLKEWLNKPSENNELIASLKNNQAIADWKNISDSTWELNDNAELMPSISAFLINYSGNKEKLAALIKDFCNSEAAKQNPKLIHNLSIIMVKLPNRDVSACLFQTLEDFFIKNPKLLDKTVFKHMAAYHAEQHLKLELSPIQKKLHLINHFGLQKNYPLVRKCCKLLISKSSGVAPADNALLKKIHKEATVENQLHKHLGKWYFVLLQFFKRYWNYGFNGVKNPSGSVNFCDASSGYTSPVQPLDTIATPLLGGQTIANQIDTNKTIQKLKARYDSFLEKQKSNSQRPKREEANAQNLPFFEQTRQPLKGISALNAMPHSSLD